MINVINLKKEYMVPVKDEGIKGSIKYLLHPTYERKIAVNGINFDIKKGECVAFIGSNGAGKSTTIKMLTGILKPSSGSIKIINQDPFYNRIENSKQIGVIFGQKTQLWWDIPIIDNFRLIKDIYEVSDEQYEQNMHAFCDMLELNDFIYQPTRKLSLGQRVRADLAAALLHNPKILFLDEPTIGLDVAVKQKIHKFLHKINIEKGTTILLTSHDISDIESICNRLIILQRGEILFDGGIEVLFDKYPTNMTLEEIVIQIFNTKELIK